MPVSFLNPGDSAMLVDRFAEYAQFEIARPLPQDVAHHAKRALIDWFAALFPGTRAAPSMQLMRAHAQELGVGRSSLPGHKTSAFAGTAAWINGSLAHAVEFDDIFRDAVYHPGPPTIGAALAVAEDRGRSGADLLKAITVGYEISTRIGAAVQPSHYRYFHTTGTAGCFGAAGAAATLLEDAARPSGDVVRHALSTSATFASGLQQAFRSDAMTKPLHAGHAAWVGVTTALGAASGLAGVPDMLEGEVGFGAAMSINPRWEAATEGLGTRYNITQITQKNHGCCGHTFAAIDAMLDLRAQHGISADQVESIRVDTYQVALDVTGNPNPRTGYEAKFSLPYVISHGLLYGAVRLNAFEPQRLHDPAIRALMAKVTLRADPELSAQFPGVRAARVSVTLRGGQTLEKFAPYRKGDPEEPLTDAELEDKFMELASAVIGEPPARKLLGQLWQVERLELAELGLTGL
jgi:2-methylcitrate dehydratase PrpD